MLRLWRLYAPRPGRLQAAGMGGMAAGHLPVTGHLPESGGAGEQAAIMLEAFDAMSEAEAEIEKAKSGH